MKKKNHLLILSAVFALLLGGAYVLYGKLGRNVAAEQLIAAERPATVHAEVKETQPQTEESETQKNETQPKPLETETPVVEESEQETQVPELEKAPDFTIYDIAGNEVHLSDYIGKPVVLNFWASWCGPCQSEMPDFDEVYAELGDEIHFLMVNMTGGRETIDTASTFIEEQGYSFPVFYDTESDAAMTYGVYSLPTTYFIDAEGYGIAQAIGAINRETLQKGIDMILP